MALNLPATLKGLALFIIALSAVLICFSFPHPSFAQTQQEIEQQRFDQSKQDYSYQFSKYQACYNQYITDRSSYISFQTATAKNTAFLTTKDCINKIYDVYIAYLRYVKEQGNIFTWNKNDSEKDSIFKTIDDEINYFQQNQPKVSGLQTLEDAVSYTSQLKDHINGTTLPLVQKALATYEVSENEAKLEDFVNLAQDLRNQVSTKADSDNSSFLANWDTEVTEIRTKSENSNQQARLALSHFKPNASDTNPLGEIQGYTKQTKSQLSKSKTILDEILKLL